MIKTIIRHSPFLHSATCSQSGIRYISRARARFVDPTAIDGPIERPTEISIGSLGSSYVIIEPDVGSSDDARPKLYINQDLASNHPSEISSPAILFRYGVASTITIKGTKDESEARFMAGALEGIERSFNRLKDA
ncbi:MAG: hypothetical protein Q9182_006373 [Xanthomendoza sp. 2 TL-2023]